MQAIGIEHATRAVPRAARRRRARASISTRSTSRRRRRRSSPRCAAEAAVPTIVTFTPLKPPRAHAGERPRPVADARVPRRPRRPAPPAPRPRQRTRHLLSRRHVPALRRATSCGSKTRGRRRPRRDRSPAPSGRGPFRLPAAFRTRGPSATPEPHRMPIRSLRPLRGAACLLAACLALTACRPHPRQRAGGPPRRRRSPRWDASRPCWSTAAGAARATSSRT